MTVTRGPGVRLLSLGCAAVCLLPVSPPAIALGCGADAPVFTDSPTLLLSLIVAMMVGVALMGIFALGSWAWRGRVVPLVWPLSSAALALLLGLAGSFAVPEFGRVFASFGADLPLHTQMLLKGQPLLWLPVGAHPLLWRWWRGRVDRPRYFAPVLLAEVFILFTVLWALYAPVFKTGCL